MNGGDFSLLLRQETLLLPRQTVYLLGLDDDDYLTADHIKFLHGVLLVIPPFFTLITLSYSLQE